MATLIVRTLRRTVLTLTSAPEPLPLTLAWAPRLLSPLEPGQSVPVVAIENRHRRTFIQQHRTLANGVPLAVSQSTRIAFRAVTAAAGQFQQPWFDGKGPSPSARPDRGAARVWDVGTARMAYTYPHPTTYPR